MKINLDGKGSVTNEIKVKPYSQPLCMGHGLCMNGVCKCNPPYTGTYCQYKGQHGDNPCSESITTWM